MTQRHPRRTDAEWIDLIQECRSSGLSDKCWCEENHIHPSNFYYQIRRLRKMACKIPEPQPSSFAKKQDIVQLCFDNPVSCLPQEKLPVTNALLETAVKISRTGFQVEITNAASKEAVFNTLSVLQKLC